MNERVTFFKKLQIIDANILSKDNSNTSKVLIHGDHSFNDEKNTSILTASIEYIISAKRLDAPLIQNWHINFSMCSLSLAFVKKLLVNVFCLALYFLYLWLISLDYFVKWFILLDFSFFSFFFFHHYLCMFHQPAKICSKSYNWIIFKLMFIYLIDFGADFCWLIPRHTKGYSVWWL